MLTTRVLPPILRSPRMQPLSAQLLSSALAQDQSALLTIMGDNPRKAFEKAQDNSASPREPSNTMLARYTSFPIPTRCSKASDEAITEGPTFVRRLTRKRAASLVHIEEDKPKSEDDDPTYQRSSNSAPSTGSREFSGHICLCQPEPKIPRPRNGEFCLLFVRKQYS